LGLCGSFFAHKIITPKQYQGLVQNFEGIDVVCPDFTQQAGIQILRSGRFGAKPGWPAAAG
jgi:hypothetical protein